jgi:hypothetical protein
MFSPSLQSLVVQAHIEELHRVAQTHNRGRTSASPSPGVDRAKATHLSAGVKRAINRMLGGSGAQPAIRGLELVAGSSAATPSPRP